MSLERGERTKHECCDSGYLRIIQSNWKKCRKEKLLFQFLPRRVLPLLLPPLSLSPSFFSSAIPQPPPRSFHLDSCPAGVGGPRIAVSPEGNRSGHRGDEPEQHVDEVDPNGVLEARDVVVAVWVLVDVDVGEDTEDGGPEDAVPIM